MYKQYIDSERGDLMSDDNPRTNRPQSPAMLVRAGLRQARLDAIGGEPLDGSDFEAEVPEPGYEGRE
jgi:hypothetical protein